MALHSLLALSLLNVSLQLPAACACMNVAFCRYSPSPPHVPLARPWGPLSTHWLELLQVMYPSVSMFLLSVQHISQMLVQDVKRHDDPELVVLSTDECLFADEGFR